MIIRVFGVNHETAPVAWREAISLTASRKVDFLNDLMDLGIEDSVLLSTCGRFELYIATPETEEESIENKVFESLETYFNKRDMREHFYVKSANDGVRHLFRVAIGLDSAVLGEDQILGQIKEAHQFAMEVGSSKKILNCLFREAVATAKAIKTELRISDHPLSLSYIGIKKIKDKFKSLSGKKVLMIGLGKMGQLALKTLIEEDVYEVVIALRNSLKVPEGLSHDPRVRFVSYDDRYVYLEEADIVISATSSPHLVIKSEEVFGIKSGAILLDIAVPRDIDSEIAQKYDVTLLNVDGLKDISEENGKRREAIAREAEGQILAAVQAFDLWLKSVQADVILNLWNEEIKMIHEDTMHILKRKLRHCEHGEMLLIDKMLMSSLKRLIRKPISALKTEDDPEIQRQMVAMLMKLNKE